MIAYVDEYGMITSTPPEENIKKQEINVEEIMISTPRKEDEEPVILRGRIEFFNEARGFGFIKDLAGIEKYFFHVNNVVTDVREGNIVTFDLERGAKGMMLLISVWKDNLLAIVQKSGQCKKLRGNICKNPIFA